MAASRTLTLAALCALTSAYRVVDGPVNVGGATIPVLLDGYDVMGYWGPNGGSAIQGNPSINITVISKDQNQAARAYELHFSSEANKAKFATDPDHYMPQYGGFCAWGVCCERKPNWPWTPTHLGPPAGVDQQSNGWGIRDGKLYFAIWQSYIQKFFQDGAQHVQEGEERWTGWFGSTTEGRLNHGCFATTQGYCTQTPEPLAPEVAGNKTSSA